MICDRCGRNNPEGLAFCQDCGRRLTAQQAVVPPTPPTGLGLVQLPEGARPEVTGAGTRRASSRPEAPPLGFGPPPAADESPVCTACFTRNPIGNRFCVSCGTRLTVPPPAPAAAPAPPVEAAWRDTYQSAQGSQPAVGPAPVVHVATAAPPAPARVICARCNGASDATMVYCQFCGANLHERHEPPRHEPPRHEPPRPESPLEQRLISRGAIDPGVARSPSDRPMPRTGQFVPMAGGAASPLGRLVTIGRDGAEGTTYPLTGEQIDVGREEGSILLREDAYISPRHLRLYLKEGVWHARDLASLNGFYIRVRQPRTLVDADLLLVGLQVLRFEAVKDAEQGFGPATQHGTLLFGSPMLPRYARLSEHTVEGVSRNVFYLHRDETIIGRESGDIVFTEDPFMSRRHLAIRLDGANGVFTAVDLGSSNGTYIAVRGETPLADGDFLRVGQHLFRIDIASSRASPQGGSPGGGSRRPS